MEKRMLNINEASEYMGIGRNNLRTLIAWEKLPVIRVGNKMLLNTHNIEKFLEENEGRNLKNRQEVIAVVKGHIYNENKQDSPC